MLPPRTRGPAAHLPLVDTLDRWIGRWAVASQQHSRRNAMVASTVLTQRRAEAREVEDFLAEHGSHGVRRVAAEVTARAAVPR